MKTNLGKVLLESVVKAVKTIICSERTIDMFNNAPCHYYDMGPVINVNI